ncbi:MAG TPA: flagellar basal body P-ring formation chaperone FlgA [Azospirillaceae bacterium]|nr:flagellar basal body P-ring formation chaperone FlgA [Azospirillaceae bacterium]
MKTIRTLALATVFTLAALPAGAATLKAQTFVNGDHIMLGDLFDGTGDDATRVVAQAPAPGRKAVFDAAYLARIAQAHRLDWHPAALTDRAVIERASQIIGTDEIRDTLARVLAPKLPAGRIQVDLDNPSLQFHLPADQTPELTVESATYVPSGSRFAAVVSVNPRSASPQRLSLTGRVVSMVDVPVLNRRVPAGEVVGSSDIDWVQVRADQAGDIIATEAELIGRAARRHLQAGSPVRGRDIQAPRAVAKGSIVTMVLKTSALTLTAQGRALQEGAVGDVIRVTNTQSNRIIEATVAGTGVVSVAKPDAAAVN